MMKRETTRRCPDKEELHTYYHKQLFGKANERVFQHIKSCDSCLNYLASMQASARKESESPKVVYPRFVEVARRA